MSTFTYRSEKGSKLTSSEIDANFRAVESIADNRFLVYHSLLCLLSLKYPLCNTKYTLHCKVMQGKYTLCY